MSEPFADPTHDQSGPSTFWSTVNAEEGLPGVSTPLNWSLFAPRVERAFRATFADLGVLPASEIRVPASVDERIWGIFYGRAAANVDVFRRLADLTPGTSGDAFEAQIFGAVRPGVTSHRSRRRYPMAAVKMPHATLGLPKLLTRHRVEIETFWRQPTPTDPDAARARFAEAAQRFEAVMRPHTLATMLAQGLYEQLRKLCTAGGRPGLETRLMTGYGASFEESKLVSDLWAVSRDAVTLQTFLGSHGYHGPSEGEISSPSWREDPSPLRPLIETYRGMDEAASPQAVERKQVQAREAATTELLAGLRGLRRPAARFLLRIAARYLPLREVGKAAFLQCFDAARGAARVVGEDLARRGFLADADDVFYLTVEELLGPPEDKWKEAVALRRERRGEYLRLRLPESWTGQPTALPAEDGVAARTDDAITGIPVSPGVVEGRARVVLHPDHVLEQGEILVCQTTDPSWAPIMLVAGGLVIDIGGALSHGAIVARELGVPCVINTRVGTRQLRTGDLVRVDGDAGVVSILSTQTGSNTPDRIARSKG